MIDSLWSVKGIARVIYPNLLRTDNLSSAC